MALIDTNVRYCTEPDTPYDESYVLRVYDWHRASFDLDDDWDLECATDECASDYRDMHDGWELTHWNNGSEPLILYIWKTPTEQTKMEVWLEFEPTYTSKRAE